MEHDVVFTCCSPIPEGYNFDAEYSLSRFTIGDTVYTIEDDNYFEAEDFSELRITCGNITGIAKATWDYGEQITVQLNGRKTYHNVDDKLVFYSLQEAKKYIKKSIVKTYGHMWKKTFINEIMADIEVVNLNDTTTQEE